MRIVGYGNFSAGFLVGFSLSMNFIDITVILISVVVIVLARVQNRK